MREYLFIFVIAAATTFATTPLVRAFAIRVGAMTAVRDRDVHVVPIPRLGGVAILLGFLAAVLAASRLPYLGGYLPSGSGVAAQSIMSDGRIMGVAVGATLVCLVGAIDDMRELDWLTKLAGQFLAAGIMAYQGVQLLSLPIFGEQTVLPLSVLIALTIIIVVVSTNAVNFVDGLDGLAAGIVGIAALTFFAYAYLLSRSYNPPNVFSSATFICAALAGCCIGFLPHNFYPARLFMGDSGALLLGLLLSAATISMTSIDPSQVDQGGGGSGQAFAWVPIGLPLAILSLPLLDVVLAVVRRTRAGRRPWHPDAHHLHHRLLRMGHPHPVAVLLMYLWASIVSFGALGLAVVDDWWPLAAIGGGVLLASLLTFSRLGSRSQETL
ncbi:undecaprenyl/decaprenyl-phosphate alpha-N-acetylglucosaminyl 1-phosphate transferase [Arsenicicoccus piscis]|uniref:Undecaprenyl-phosphate alpha-N-acetylglucosaminyl 1-phosphate transferase n=1 Tax=Arsenicicoccus piscis TaxID=673954 RepID=A0ABQ6HP96_9MICO|nr:MraY family glycosyltransferase [Arsenicicoccus piscis]MCH8629146.1 undecaprenyl/decaprenyl-phosphate alpha-N-acetylglucosaminyl 1-phosphate transferase [Arsenicicoccus piscis]GMA20290.1 undecaprenyl-phosphate alpha-N-acetylglucosaminyl 1-phosphate transferase [Arsenicicoccus piscis]